MDDNTFIVGKMFIGHYCKSLRLKFLQNLNLYDPVDNILRLYNFVALEMLIRLQKVEKKMNTNKVCGKFPPYCYKAFECKEYAERFMKEGIFRMGCLRSYKTIEDDKRRDPTEGSGHTKEPGIENVGWVSKNLAEKTIWVSKPGFREHHSEYGNAIFGFCTSLPEVNRNHMKNDFGTNIVKIDNPKKLAEDINDYFISKEPNFLIEGNWVIYNKGQKLKKKLTDNERSDMAYTQKPERFSPDCEFRIVAIKFGEPCKKECKYLSGQFEQVEPDCKFIEIRLGKQLDYLSLVT